MAVPRIVGGVEVERNFSRCGGMPVEERRGEEAIDLVMPRRSSCSGTGRLRATA